MSAPAKPRKAQDDQGDKERRNARRIAWISGILTFAGTLITAGSAVAVAVITAPDTVRDVVGDRIGVTHTATATATVTTTVTAGPAAPSPQASAADATTGGTAATSLTRPAAVDVDGCGPPGGFSNDWLDRSVTLAGSDEQFNAMTCRVESSGAVAGYLDYVVPQNATTFTAKVGIDRASPNTSARVRFSVVDLDDNVLAQQVATYTNAPGITARVSGVPRIRLKMTVVKSSGVSGSNYFRSAWINPSFG
ncbi:NPCBM/NEW2 domain-containing protein [Microbispora rosea]|uniref:NPCBM/NEW2 domain-containing protein n=1 Tax=Microbispora rosea TaxID=58117 RepID=UPI0037AFB3DE